MHIKGAVPVALGWPLRAAAEAEGRLGSHNHSQGKAPQGPTVFSSHLISFGSLQE